jgi:hypothetical protein
MDDKERLSQQRMMLNQRLGLDAVGALGIDTSCLFNDDDLKASTLDPQQTPPASPPLTQVMCQYNETCEIRTRLL